MRDVGEHDAYTDEPYMEELAGLDMFAPSGQHRGIRRVKPWQCGVTMSHGNVVTTLHWANGKPCRRHCTLIIYLQCHLARRHHHHSLRLPCGSAADAIGTCRKWSRTFFSFVTDQAHTEAFGGPALWGRGVPQEDSFNKHGHVATQSCATAMPGSTRHRDRDVVLFSQAADINVQDAIKVVPNTKEVL